MNVPRQGKITETGRVNQKRRTRAALVTAAEDLLAQGTTPTVAQAAEAALVSRTTAYRYFPTQESLLLELAVTVDVDDVEELVARPLGDDSATDRLLAVIELFNRHVFDDEMQYRTALRLYLDQWLDATSTGDDAPLIRLGRRVDWYRRSLESVRDTVPEHELDRLVAALSMLSGGEAVVVMRDVCGLGPVEGRAVVDWAARTLLEATFGSSDGPPRS
jgi:AcrR family transcriptional regulator